MFYSNPRTRSMVALFAAMVVLAAACGASGDNGDEGGIASINNGASEGDDGSSSSDSQGTAEAPADAEDAFALYDDCMAKAGFAIQTIELGEGTGDAIALAPTSPAEDDPQAAGSDADFGGEEFEEANTACQVHLVNVDAGFDLSPEQETAFADADLKWTQCMRDQGIDMPDTAATGGVAVEPDGTGEGEGDDPQAGAEASGADFDFDAFDAAAQACESIFDEINSLTEEGSDQ